MAATSLVSLPDLVLVRIGSFLIPEDNQSLGLTCKRLYSVLPRYLVLKGKDFEINGPSWGHFTPEPYFNGPALTGRVKKLFISLIWRDQGWGNRKGDVIVSLMRGEEIIAEKYNILGVAPHKEEYADTDISDDPIVTQTSQGDYYKFTRNPGGGGGHQLFVKNYKVIIQFYD